MKIASDTMKRSPWVAALLSLWFPGTGHLYLGRPAGVVAGVLGLNAYFLLGFFYGMGSVAKLALTLVIGLTFSLGLAGHAAFSARDRLGFPRRWFNRWYSLAFVVLVAPSLTEQFWVSAVLPHARYVFLENPNRSMEPTIREGERFIADNWAYRNSSPERGDLVVASYPDGSAHIKRLIGIGGERVRIVDKAVYIDDVPLDEPYKQHIAPPNTYADPFRDNFPPLIQSRPEVRDPYWYEQFVSGDQLALPEGRDFLLGDNRDNSSDSRYVGLIDAADIQAKVLYVYWSEDLSRIGLDLE